MKIQLLFILLICTSCFFKSDRVHVSSSDEYEGPIKARIHTIKVLNNQKLYIEGQDLDSIRQIRLKTPSGENHLFEIESQNSGQLFALGTQNIMLALNTIFSLVISDANASSTFSIEFTLQDGAVTASKLNSMDAEAGQILRFDGRSWRPSDLWTFLQYAGNWDADLNNPDLTTGGSANQYYIVTTAGTTDLFGGDGSDSWQVGDWVVWNEFLNQWEKIDNASYVTSFNGRRGEITPQMGDYSWEQIDKALSSLEDIGDVDSSGIAVGKVLKWDGAQWVVGDDLVDGGADSVDSSIIADGAIVDDDISVSAGIAQSKIDGLSSDLASKLSLSGGTLTGNINMGVNNIVTDGLVDGVDVSAMNSQVGALSTSVDNKEDAISAGTSGQYFRGDKTWQDLDKAAVGLDNLTNDAQIPLSALDSGPLADSSADIPTSGAVKTYVDNAMLGLSTGDFKADGTIAMTGDLDLGNNKAKFKSNNNNYVDLKAPDSLAGAYSIIFPLTDGNSGQVLTTDGSGVLSWSTPTGGDVSGITAGVGLTGGGSSGNITVNADVGTGANQIVQLDTSGRLPAVDGSQITNIPILDTLMTGFTTASNDPVDASDTLKVAIEKLQQQVSDNSSDIAFNEGLVNIDLATKEDAISAGTSGQYFRGDKTWQALDKAAVGLDNLTNDAQIPLSALDSGPLADSSADIPTSGAVKTYVDNAVSGLSTGDFKADGSIAMTGDLDLGNNKAKFKSDNNNYVDLKAPDSLAAAYSIIFPPTDGDSGQVLTTDGSGVLSWSTPTGGDISGITAGVGLTGGGSSGNITVNADVGTGANQIVQLDASGRLPAVDGSQLTNIPILDTLMTGFTTASNAPVDASDTLKVAIEKLQQQVSDNSSDIAFNENLANIDLATKEDAISVGTNGQYFRGDKTWQNLNTSVVAEGANQYFTSARARNAVVLNDTSGNETQQAPSISAMKSYIADNSGAGTVSSISGGAGLSDGPITTTGTIDVNVDNSTLEIISDIVRVKDGGISTSKISSGAVNDSKISDMNASKLTGTLSADRLPANVVQLDGSNRLPAVDGSQLTNLPAANLTVENRNRNYTLATRDRGKLLLVTGNTNLTLPSARSIGNGYTVTIKRGNSANNVLILPNNGSETIDGLSLQGLFEPYSALQLVSTGSEWLVSYSKGRVLEIAPDDICPTGYILIPGNATLGTSDFCVMRFEAKQVSGAPSSRQTGAPWVYHNPTNAFNACNNLNGLTIDEGFLFTGTFALISNREWMTVARNAELTDSNWTGGVVGSGNMFVGHTDSGPNSNLAVSDSTDPYTGTNNSASDSIVGQMQRRTLNISSNTGEEESIWDFAGNVSEWVDWDSSDNTLTLGPGDISISWRSLSDLGGNKIDALDLQPSTLYTGIDSFSQRHRGLGRWVGGNNNLRVAARGGYRSIGEYNPECSHYF